MIIGIDLGTTKSVASIWQDGLSRIIPSESGNNSIPSIVLVTPNEEIYAGDLAKRHRDRYISKNITIGSVKRLMGKQGETGWGWWKTYPQEVSAFILSELKYNAEKYLNQPVNQAVIAIPSHFDESQRRATKEAGEIAGIEVLRLLNEATAAALTYAYGKKGNEKILLFDLGGGTLDVSIVDFGDNVYEVICTEGDDKLGGDDFDEVIVDYIMNNIFEQYGTKIELDPVRQLMMKEVAEQAKIDLSNADRTDIRIPGFIEIRGQSKELYVCLERTKFEGLSRHLFDRTKDLLSRSLNSAKLNASELNAVLLLGGSSRIPYIRKIVKEVLGKTPFTGVDPDICVAQGAAIQAGILAGEGKLRDLLLLDVIPSSYGIGTVGGACTKMIEKNTIVPTSKTNVFSTTEDNQSIISVSVYQGEGDLVKNNTLLGILELSGIPPAPKGVPQIEVTFQTDCNMIINVSAKDLGTSKQTEAIIRSPYGLNENQLQVMQRRMESWLFDRERRETVDLLIRKVKDLASTGVDALACEDILVLNEHADLLTVLVKQRVPRGEFKDAISRISSFCERAETIVSQHRQKAYSFNSLIAKIEEFVPILEQFEKSEADLLTQGKNLIKDCLERKIGHAELDKICLGVHYQFKESKVKLIKQALQDLEGSGQVAKIIRRMASGPLSPSLVAQELCKLRKSGQVDIVINLLKQEERADLDEIEKKLLTELNSGSLLWAHLVLIVSSFVDYRVLSYICEIKNDDIGDFVRVALFAALDKNREVSCRRIAAEIIAKYTCDKKHFWEILDYICGETNTTIKKPLLNYVDSQPSGTLLELFSGAPSAMRIKIQEDKDILLRLAKEPDEATCIFALECLSRFWDRNVKELVLSFVCTGSTEIKCKALSIASRFAQSDETVAEMLIKALGDCSPLVRGHVLGLITGFRTPAFRQSIYSLAINETDMNVKSSAIRILGKFEDSDAVEKVLSFTLSNQAEIRNVALSVLESNRSIDKDFYKLLVIIRRTVIDGQSLKFMDSLYLWWYCRQHPELNHIKKCLREWNKQRQK